MSNLNEANLPSYDPGLTGVSACGYFNFSLFGGRLKSTKSFPMLSTSSWRPCFFIYSFCSSIRAWKTSILKYSTRTFMQFACLNFSPCFFRKRTNGIIFSLCYSISSGDGIWGRDGTVLVCGFCSWAAGAGFCSSPDWLTGSSYLCWGGFSFFSSVWLIGILQTRNYKYLS